MIDLTDINMDVYKRVRQEIINSGDYYWGSMLEHHDAFTKANHDRSVRLRDGQGYCNPHGYFLDRLIGGDTESPANRCGAAKAIAEAFGYAQVGDYMYASALDVQERIICRTKGLQCSIIEARPMPIFESSEAAHAEANFVRETLATSFNGWQLQIDPDTHELDSHWNYRFVLTANNRSPISLRRVLPAATSTPKWEHFERGGKTRYYDQLPEFFSARTRGLVY